MEEILNDVLNATGSLAGGMGAHLNESVARNGLDEKWILRWIFTKNTHF